MPNVPISYPARYAPGVALNFADTGGEATLVSQSNPLPVTLAASSPNTGTTSPAPLSGTAASPQVAGPFTALAGKPIVLTLSGTWTGTVQLLRSINGGATRHPVTAAGGAWARFAANACEPVWEENESGAQFYLDLAPATGTITYRMAQ